MKINYVNSIYGEIGVKSLSAQLGLCRTRMAKAKLLSLNEILTAIRNVLRKIRYFRSDKTNNFTPCKSIQQCLTRAIFLTTRRVKIWLYSTMTQQRFIGSSILNSHKVKTDNIDLLVIANNFVCNDSRRRSFGLFTRDDL